jgi:hypothetical protein
MTVSTFTVAIVGLLAVRAAAAEVRLRSAATCACSIVRVADVAEVFDADPRTAQALADTPLCPAPAKAGERTLTKEEIRQLIVLSGLEPKVLITGGDEVRITFQDASAAASQARRPVVLEGVRQTVFALEATAPSRALAKPMPPQLAPEAKATTRPATVETDVVLVERGSGVTVNARTGGIRITTSGKALEAGKAGDTVAVELADSKQRVLARVTGPQTVEVSVGGAATSQPLAAQSATAIGTGVSSAGN